MNINSISCYNNNQNLACKKPNTVTSFKSTMPVKVFIDGLPSGDKTNIDRGIKKLYSILFNPKKNDLETEISNKFLNAIKDFKPEIPCPSEERKIFITSSSIDEKNYMFTGPEAEKLSEIGHKLGISIRKGKEKNIPKTFETKSTRKEYIEQIKNFVQPKSKTLITDKNKNKMGLCIFTTSNGKFGKKSFNLTLDDIKFRKIEESISEQTPPKPQTTAKPKNPSKKNIVADFPAMAPKKINVDENGQGTLFD